MSPTAGSSHRPVSEIMLRCTACGSQYRMSGRRWRCECGSPLDVAHAAVPLFSEPGDASPGRGVWRFVSTFPFDTARPVSLGEGGTPVASLTYRDTVIHAKLDHLMPTGSYKDRGATTLITAARELGVGEIVEDSSGNAGCAIAAYAALAGIACRILVPEGTSEAKTRQIRAYGAEVETVPGDREATARAARDAARDRFYASHVWNPLFFEGIKTIVYELYYDFGRTLPGAIIVPVGNGSLLLGMAMGIAELLHSGAVEASPRLVAVQSDRCGPLYRMFHSGSGEGGAARSRTGAARGDVATSSGVPTIVEGIAIASPPRLDQMYGVVESTGTEVVQVSDEAVVGAVGWALRRGLYLEPTGAVTLAAAMKMIDAGTLSPGDGAGVVAVTTGIGFKAADKVASLFAG